MNLAERIQHILLIVSFTLLVLTGLPLMFYELRIFKSIFSFENAFAFRGLLHRAAAVLLIVDIVWHTGYTVLTRRGRNNFRELMPRAKDGRDAVALFGYNVGLSRAGSTGRGSSGASSTATRSGSSRTLRSTAGTISSRSSSISRSPGARSS